VKHFFDEFSEPAALARDRSLADADPLLMLRVRKVIASGCYASGCDPTNLAMYVKYLEKGFTELGLRG
jgi:hypothetical protein